LLPSDTPNCKIVFVSKAEDETASQNFHIV